MVNSVEVFAICVCTHQRPKMLTRCLLSLAKLKRYDSWRFVFIIVDNELAPNNHPTIEKLQSTFCSVIKYVHQPKRGIAAARNAALDVALEEAADWVCFFDDDQYADKYAVIAAYQVALDMAADMVSMQVHYFFQNKLTLKRQKTELGFAGAGGVLFSAFLISADGLGLRYDEAIGLGTGEDLKFRALAVSLGIRIAYAKKALVYEEIVEQRTKFWPKIYRGYCATVDCHKYNIPNKEVDLKLYWKIARKLLGIAELPLLVFYFFISTTFFNSRKFKIVYRFFQGCGIIAGLLNANPKYYKKTQGY